MYKEHRVRNQSNSDKHYLFSGILIFISGICCYCSVAQSCPTLCEPMDCSMPGFPVHHQLLELTQTHVHRVGDAIQPSHPLLPLSPPTFNLSQHQTPYDYTVEVMNRFKGLDLIECLKNYGQRFVTMYKKW